LSPLVYPHLPFLYDASGVKLKKTETYMGNMTDSRYYFSNFEYNNNMQLEYIHTTEGRIRMAGGTLEYDYYLKDHLGNTRVVFTDNESGTPEVQQVSNYYPFGMRFGETNQIGTETTDYMYNGKEFQEELGWYDYGWRFYDPAIGRWMVIDPQAHLYDEWSPYCYVGDNPIKRIDPDGQIWGNVIGAIVGAAVEYGTQVAVNYLRDKLVLMHCGIMLIWQMLD